MSHYETLGVPRDAEPEQIRAAFRKKARDNHPDRGGDGTAMAEVNRANDVLSDPERRSQYDRTGQDQQQASPEAKAQARLMALFDQYLAQDSEANCDLVGVFRGSVEHHIAEMRLLINKAEQKIKKLEPERSRMKGPGDLFQQLADQRLVSQRQLVARNREDVEIDGLVLKLLADWKDVAPPAPVPQQQPAFMSSTSGIGGLGGWNRF